MTLWSDGLAVWREHAWAVFVFLLAIAWGGSIMRGVLYRLFIGIFDELELFSLSVAGWFFPVLSLSFFAFVLTLAANIYIALAIMITGVVATSLIWIKPKINWGLILIAFAAASASILLRLAYIHDLALPNYFDSAEHYRRLGAILVSYQTGEVAAELKNIFYHLGFHILAAAISRFGRVNAIESMLVIGQVLLAILPFAFFFIIRRETQSNVYAWFACLLAGFGFHMPSHLMNWGKYPALLSLFPILFVPSLYYLMKREGKINKSTSLLLACAVLFSFLIHVRTMVVFSLMLIAFALTAYWKRMSASRRSTAFVLLSLLCAIEIGFIHADPSLDLLLNGYLESDLPILALVLLLSGFAALYFSEITFFLLCCWALCLVCLFIPVTLPLNGLQTLLDRPFVQMLTFIPLSMIAGFGMAGLHSWITPRLSPDRKWMRHFITFSLFGFVLLNISRSYAFYPSDCCRFVTRDDLAALTWIDGNTAKDTDILIASSTLAVSSYETSDLSTSVDAGIWAAVLLQRRTTFAPSQTQFQDKDTHMELCALGLGYIYTGGMPQSFDHTLLDLKPEWYLPSFRLPSAKVYQLTGCE